VVIAVDESLESDIAALARRAIRLLPPQAGHPPSADP
jgi:hypothetical protein